VYLSHYIYHNIYLYHHYLLKNYIVLVLWFKFRAEQLGQKISSVSEDILNGLNAIDKAESKMKDTAKKLF
jgi:hypothetical protein